MPILLAVAALLAGDTNVVSQQAPAAAPVAAEPAAKPEKPKKICRRLEEETGSHMSSRVCKTAEEWESYDQGASADDLNTKGANIH